jgi:bla regulator protein BlaR1
MEALLNNIIKATGWSIFHSLWQGAFLYGLMVLIFVMVPTLSARVKHNMAYGTLSLIFIGFCGTFFSLFTWPPLSTVSNTLALSNFVPASVNQQAEHYFPLLVSIYVIGLFLQLAILGTGYYKILQLKHSVKLAVPQEWQLLFKGMMAEMNISKKAAFYLSPHVTVPLVIGFIKPVILFPVAFATQLDLVHVEAILIHELAHIRRNDYLLNIVKTVMETILFFNPFTWLCSNLIQREREHACDDLVVRKTHTPLTYAHALLQIELLKEKQTPAFSMAAGGNNQHLYERIKRITDMKTTYNTAKQQLFAIGITLSILVSLAWINPLKSEPIVKKKITTATLTEVCTEASPLVFQQDTTKKNKNKSVNKNLKGAKGTKAIKRVPAVPAAPPAPPAAAVPGVPPVPPKPVKEDELTQQQIKEIEKQFNSAEWKKHEADIEKMSADMEKQFNSAEWKKNQAENQNINIEIRKHFNSPEFKKEMENIKKQSVVISRHFNSPEWKKQQADIQKMGLEMKNRVNSPEFKKMIQEQKALYNSPEYKELQSKFQKDVEALKHKKELEAGKQK